MNLKHTFSKVFLINLERRKDRLQSVLDIVNSNNWPFQQPEIFIAIDGNKVPTPPKWESGGGAWGCRQSHVAILQNCIQNDIEPILILEDDIVVKSSFYDNCYKFFNSVPKDWQCLMLGGQHMQTPYQVSPGIVRTTNCQRTHAYAIRGRFMRDLYATWASPQQTNHIDWNFGPMQAYYNTYAPEPFLFGQSRTMSDINGRVNPTKFWQPPSGNEIVLVLNCEKDLVEQLRKDYNIHTGYDRDKNGIDNGLHKVFSTDTKDIKDKLRSWINDLQWECVSEEGAVLGVWHPQSTLELIRSCWNGPVIEVRTLEDALPYINRTISKVPLHQSHVVLLHADKAIADMLPFLHFGYWRDVITGHDNGVRKWVQHHRIEDLTNVIETLARESESIKNSIPTIWHPEVTLEEMRQASPHRQVVYLKGSNYESIQNQWLDYISKYNESKVN